MEPEQDYTDISRKPVNLTEEELEKVSGGNTVCIPVIPQNVKQIHPLNRGKKAEPLRDNVSPDPDILNLNNHAEYKDCFDRPGDNNKWGPKDSE